uniref:Venom S1 protease 38 n=1 Tax=Oncocephalus sp. TaxID=2944721 RepID=A0AB38ZEQ7_9HEMI
MCIKFAFVFIMIVRGSVMGVPIEEQDSSEHGVATGQVGTDCPCGWSNKARARIVGGVDADPHEWPMMAGFVAKTGSYKPNKLVCGGTLVSRRHIVTAGHCVHTNGGRPLQPEQLHVVLGAHKLSDIDYNDPKVMRTIEKFIAHPNYKHSTVSYDIAIALLEEAVQFSNIIGPACLPTKRIYPVGNNLKAIGWGFIDMKATEPDALQETTVKVVNPSLCSAYNQFDMKEGYQFCTYQGGSSGQCVGDSGGPILWRDPETNRYTLVAFPSFSAAGCVWKPAVVSDVTYFLPWIQQVVSESAPAEQTCTKLENTNNNDILVFPD